MRMSDPSRALERMIALRARRKFPDRAVCGVNSDRTSDRRIFAESVADRDAELVAEREIALADAEERELLQTILLGDRRGLVGARAYEGGRDLEIVREHEAHAIGREIDRRRPLLQVELGRSLKELGHVAAQRVLLRHRE